LAIGAALAPGTISGDAARTLATFLGLFAASILPTVTLLVNSMTASGRSVKAVSELEKELEAAMDALFLLFGCVIVSVGALVSLSIAPPDVLKKVPYLTSEVLPRVGQCIVVSTTGLILLRAGQIPGILRRTLKLRKEIAVAEARTKLSKSATSTSGKQIFPTHPDFGKVVTLEDLKASDKEKH
jgi:hypothetical protein